MFVFDTYTLHDDARTITFTYRYDRDNTSHTFREDITLPAGYTVSLTPCIDAILFEIHLMLGISYWKAFLDPHIVIESGTLSHSQAQFWEKVYRNGLGELFYRNNINDYKERVAFPYKHLPEHATLPCTDHASQPRALVGVGGGKDSIVTGELLKNRAISFDGFVVETGMRSAIIEDVIRVMDVPTVVVRRTIDPHIGTMPEAYDGHVPISAIWSWIGLLVATVGGYQYIITSNERSANIGNKTWHGYNINHQWSKSSEYEKLFNDYINTHITSSVSYFSLLRPLSELRIVHQFIQYPSYFPVFSSCNRNFSSRRKLDHNKRWCGMCAKCAFVYLLIAAVAGRSQADAIVGKNVLDDATLIDTYRALAGVTPVKPFDCVGTHEEVIAACAIVQARKEHESSPVMEMINREVLTSHNDTAALIAQELKRNDPSHMPEVFASVVGELPSQVDLPIT